jgi:hypothetical protein
MGGKLGEEMEKNEASGMSWWPWTREDNAASTRVSHAVSSSWARSVSVEDEFKILNSELKRIQPCWRLTADNWGSSTLDPGLVRESCKNVLVRTKHDLVTTLLELELKRCGLRDMTPQSRSPRNWNGVSVKPRLNPTFPYSIFPKPVRIRGWCYWQSCRAKWVLQKCQYPLESEQLRLGYTRFPSRALELQVSQDLTKNFLSVGQHFYWLVGPIWACSRNFHEMAILKLLFLTKYATTLL